MAEPFELPPELRHIADALGNEPPGVRELFHYALVLMMVDDEKARVISMRSAEERTYLAIETIAGEVFEVVRPEISDELEKQLLQEVRLIVEQENQDDKRMFR